MRFLLIEDNSQIAGVIFDYFETFDYTLDYASDGLHGLQLASEHSFDLIILDIMLPGMDGLTLCSKLRERCIETPVLMLTARDTTEDTLAGFEQGADDYLIKPFELSILKARIEALVRRSKPGRISKKLIFGDLEMNLDQHTVERQGKSISLNPACYKLLQALLEKAPEVATKSDLTYALWGHEPPDGDSLRNHIYQLRSLIDKPFNSAIVSTVPKTGYRLLSQES